jgi:hypothetical protein
MWCKIPPSVPVVDVRPSLKGVQGNERKYKKISVRSQRNNHDAPLGGGDRWRKRRKRGGEDGD